MVFVWGNYFGFKKKLANLENLELYRFYEMHHLLFIPLFWQKRIGLFESKHSNYFYELDISLEKRLLKLNENSNESVFINEIKKYNSEEKKKQDYYKFHKKELSKKDDKEFIKFLKSAGIILALILIALILRMIF